jgi:fibrillarin-like pre-rRNA processing protein
MTGTPGSPREPPALLRRGPRERTTLWTHALGVPPALHGEHVIAVRGSLYRHWETARSKLAAGLARGWADPLPERSEHWLYLGAASGTTATHVADLVGPAGAVFSVEKSARPFLTLVDAADRYPNLFPILQDARVPDEYAGLVPPVDGLYQDVAQPDQIDIALANARLYLRGGGKLLLALKTSSLGRTGTPAEKAAAAVHRLETGFTVRPPLSLEPHHRQHFLLGGRATPGLFREHPDDPVRKRSRAARAQ